MIFKIGPLPEVPEFIPDGNWSLVSEPSIWGFQLKAIPIGILTTVIFTFLWITFTPVGNIINFIHFPPTIFDIIKNAISIVGIIIVHELIHAFIHPRFGTSKKTVIIFWPSRMFFCTIYTGEQTKNRCLAVLILPFIIISIMPLLFAIVTQIAFFRMAYISIVNALLSCGDILAIIMIIIRLFPKNAIIRSKGWRTYWRPN